MADQAPQNQNAQNADNSSNKFYTHFLFKPLLVTLLLVITPFFPTKSPDFGTTTPPSRVWELLHLILVGIAVSYGLFSRRNDSPNHNPNPNSNHSSKFENAESYISRLLQVSSVFDEPADDKAEDTSSGSEEIGNSNKFQTWNSQYHRNQVPMLVANRRCSGVGEKPLLLPVRSLKSRVLEREPVKEDYEASGVHTRSNSSSSIKDENGIESYTRSNSSPNLEGFSSSSSRRRRNKRPISSISSPNLEGFSNSTKQDIAGYEKSETKTESFGEERKVQEAKVEEKPCNKVVYDDDEGPDVDRKADEFIAKFREQIKLQRIESIKRSATGQLHTSFMR